MSLLLEDLLDDVELEHELEREREVQLLRHQTCLWNAATIPSQDGHVSRLEPRNTKERSL